MDIEDVVLVATVRENIRNHTLEVDTVVIPGRVEAAQAGKLVRIDSVDVPSAISTSGAFQQASSPMAEKRDSEEYDTGEVGGDALVSPVAVRSKRQYDLMECFRKRQGHQRMSMGGLSTLSSWRTVGKKWW